MIRIPPASVPRTQHVSADLLLGTVLGSPIYLPSEARARAQTHARAIASELGSNEIETSMAAYWSLTSRAQQWQLIVDHIGWDTIKQARIVEVGSGLGLFTLVGRLLGLDVTGVEYSADRYHESLRIAQSFLLANNPVAPLINAQAEALPIETASIDLVTSFQTLEHVASVRQTLTEMRRVLKPGGFLFAQAPNYDSFYEPHYGVAAPLMLGKPWLKNYLRLCQRPTTFLDHLQWLSPKELQQLLAELGFSEITITRIKAPKASGERLLIEPASLPYRFRRGGLGYKLAKVLAVTGEKLGFPNHYPQLQLWAKAQA